MIAVSNNEVVGLMTFSDKKKGEILNIKVYIYIHTYIHTYIHIYIVSYSQIAHFMRSILSCPSFIKNLVTLG